MFAPDGRPAGAALAYEGCGNQRRGRADAFNKVCCRISCHMLCRSKWKQRQGAFLAVLEWQDF
eukprot:1161823-Pelagomonas_calceolata.AAC.2